MREQWTANLIGTMHLYEITQIQLAEQLGVTAGYVNMVLNGKKSPRGASDKFQAALTELIRQKTS